MRTLVIAGFLLAQLHSFAQSEKHRCPCTDIGFEAKWADSAKIGCFRIPVLRDASKPGSGTFDLAVVIAPSINNAKQEPLLYLHGGPGIATLGNVPKYLKSKTWEMLRQNRPLIFLDYRGTGFSEPDLCPGLMDSLALAGKLPPEKLQKHKIELFRDCRIKHRQEGIDVSTFSSHQLAEDAEAVRKALAIERWSVYGVSHGTTVALNLLRNHPAPVHAMILDSPFPPNAPWLDFVRPFAESFTILENSVARNSETAALFGSLRQDFVKGVKRLNANPYMIPIDDKGTQYPFTGNDFAWSVWNAMLKPANIAFVPLAITEVAAGNDSILPKWLSSFNNPDGFGKFSDFQSKAILCYEGRPRSAEDTNAALSAKYPDFTPMNIDFEGDLCAAWQPSSAPATNFEAVTSSVPVLIFSGELDPVCPPVFGALTAKTLNRSTFVTVPAASHAAIHMDDCTRTIARDFLQAPATKPSLECVMDRPSIKFVTSNLEAAISASKKQ